MAKARSVEVGDWSESGTFLRKPANGWLHDDRDLTNTGITYKIHYLGCIEVKSSMRTLQYQTRIQVTKEAITRLAETAQRITPNKKRKLPKQLQKLLGEVDTHWASEVNLSVSVDSLRICAKSNREIMNHSLPSISFASGGDEVTANFIGYVAKDPIHERACHVFECEDSQYVLTTIGQAFELRYKMYLQNPQTRSGGSTHSEKGASPIKEPPPFAPPTTPPTSLSQAEQLVPKPPSAVKLSPPVKPRTYSNLPGFPAVAQSVQTTSQGKQLNIYDGATQASASAEFSETGDYSNPGEITDTHQTDDYVRDTTFKTVRQMGPRDEDDIDLTPSGIDLTPPDEFEPPSERLTIYANTLELNTNGSAIYANSLENGASLFANTLEDHTSALTTSYEDPEKFAAQGIYDDPNITLDSAPPQALGRPLPQAQNMGGRPLPQVQNMGGRPLPQAQNMVGRPLPQAQNMGGRPLPQAQDVGGRPPTGRPLPQNAQLLNSEGNRPIPTPRSRAKMEPSPTAVRKEFSPTVQKVPSPTLVQSGPKFDDTIYAKRVDSPGGISSGPGGISSGGIEISPVLAGQQLKRMVYFHGTISRVEAEAMLERDGDFLVRESGKQPGQYVLTGMGGGKLQHLLLIDKQGKVKSRDREFESIPHLVDHFVKLKTPLIIGESEVYLKRPIVNSFQNT